MSIGMAMGLSLKNLLSKGKRTAMVSVAGSIGIIGVSMVLAISAGVQGYIRNMENDMLSGNPVSVTQSSFDFTSLMSISQDNTKIDLKELAKNEKIYVQSLLDTLGTFAQGFEKTNTITEAYIDYVSKIPEESVNVIQYDYAFNIINNLYTDYKVSNNLSEHLISGSSATYNGGNMSVNAIREMYASVLSHVEEYKDWGSMIGSVRTLDEVPDNFDYIMSQYDVLAVDMNGKAVTTGYTDEQLKEMFEAKETLVMVVSDYRFNDLMLAEYGYFTEDEFLDYAFAGVGREEELTLVGSDGFPYSFFVGDDAKKFTYYPNDSVYSKQTFKAQYLQDEDIEMLLKPMLLAQGRTVEEANAFVNMILTTREQGDEAFLALLTQMGFERWFGILRKPASDWTEGYIANAYTDAYQINDDGNIINLPAIEKSKGVELGVKMILQKKADVSYGCLDTGLYYTNALTNYILDSEAESEIVKYIEENGALDEVPCYFDYYYVYEAKGEQDAALDGKYIFDKEKSTIDTGASLMSSIIGSITGSASTQITAAMVGGSKLPTAIYLYTKDFTAKDKVTAHLNAWNAMCERGEKYSYTKFDGTADEVTLELKNKITYNDTVGLIIEMINTMIEMITIALVAFTALSLVVSTVMIGIITYVSVVERIKEIGILRAVGARKKDIKRLFNAETFIIGLAAGIFGIIITYVLSLIINIIVLSIAGIWGIAALPWWQAGIMILLSVVLTLISGLIPAAAAAKKDPVVALRTE